MNFDFLFMRVLDCRSHDQEHRDLLLGTLPAVESALEVCAAAVQCPQCFPTSFLVIFF